MNKTTHTFTADPDDAGQRLDRFLVSKSANMSRSRLQTLIAQACVSSQGTVITDASYKVKDKQGFVLVIPETEPSHILPQDIPLDILFEDEHMLVINKPAGLTVHPAPGHTNDTLVNALLAHCGESLSGIGGVARPGIVHRIDKDTTGLLVVAKHDNAHLHLSEQLATRTLKRTYHAVAWGIPTPSLGTITGNIGRSISNRQKMAIQRTGGKAATTHYKTLNRYGFASLVECQLETGRTHQIRVHMHHITHPLIGDQTYGNTTKHHLNAAKLRVLPDHVKDILYHFNRQALHAQSITFIHPDSNETMQFSCDLPNDMQLLVDTLASTQK